jgi:hypothetical protein
MEKPKMANSYSVTLLLIVLALLLGACSDGTNEASHTNTPKENTSNNDPEEGMSTNTIEESQDTSESKEQSATEEDPENEKGEGNESSANKDAQNNVTGEGSNEDGSGEETAVGDQEGASENANQSINPIQDTAAAEEKEKAVSLTKKYLGDRNELIQDEDHFVQYDGMINEYIIVRYSTLVSGHSSTNGRYAVDLTTGKVKDVTAGADFNKLFSE